MDERGKPKGHKKPRPHSSTYSIDDAIAKLRAHNKALQEMSNRLSATNERLRATNERMGRNKPWRPGGAGRKQRPPGKGGRGGRRPSGGWQGDRRTVNIRLHEPIQVNVRNSGDRRQRGPELRGVISRTREEALRSFSAHQTQIARLETQLSERTREIAELQRKAEEGGRGSTEATNRLARVEVQKEDLQRQLTTVKEDHNRFQTEATARHDRFVAQLGERQIEIARLQENLANGRETIARLERDIDQRRGDINEHRDMIAELQAHNQNLAEQLHDHVNEIHELREAIAAGGHQLPEGPAQPGAPAHQQPGGVGEGHGEQYDRFAELRHIDDLLRDHVITPAEARRMRREIAGLGTIPEGFAKGAAHVGTGATSLFAGLSGITGQIVIVLVLALVAYIVMFLFRFIPW